jgi:hypothetical protein
MIINFGSLYFFSGYLCLCKELKTVFLSGSGNMPRKSERELLLNDVESTLKFAIFQKVLQSDSDSDNSSTESTDSEFDAIQTISILHSAIVNNRYLETRDKHIPKSQDFVENYFLDQPDSQFQVITRVSKETFFYCGFAQGLSYFSEQ